MEVDPEERMEAINCGIKAAMLFIRNPGWKTVDKRTMHVVSIE